MIETLFDNKQKRSSPSARLTSQETTTNPKTSVSILIYARGLPHVEVKSCCFIKSQIVIAPKSGTAFLQIDCQNLASQNGITGGGIMPGSVSELPLPTYLQDECSQPQPISATPDFSAFLQYSLQYFSSGSIKQSQVGCAHFRSLSAIRTASLP